MPHRLERWLYSLLIVPAAAYTLVPALAGVAPRWWLTPIGIIAVLVPLLRAFEGGELPRHGPPHWLRRLIFWEASQFRRNAVVLLLFTLVSLWITGRTSIAALRMSAVKPEATAVPFALLHLFLNLGFVFLIRSHRLDPARTLRSLLVLEVAGRCSIAGMDVEWQGLESAVIVAKAICLYAFAAMLEIRGQRGLPPIGMRRVLGEALSAAAGVDRDFQVLLAKVIRPGWQWRILIPLELILIAAAIVIAWWYKAKTLPTLGFVPFPIWTGVLLMLTCIYVCSVEASSGVRNLLQGGILSELLLTPIKPGEVLCAIALRSLFPLVRTLLIFLLIMQAAHSFLIPVWTDFAIPAALLALCLGTVVVAALLIGPLVDASVRHRILFVAVLKTILQFTLLETFVLGMVFFTLNQAAFASDGFVFVGFAISHALVLLWVFLCWQRLMGDFVDLAHGNIEDFRWLATRDQVKRYRDLLKPPKQPAPPQSE